MLRFDGKSIVVTGSGSGLGRAAAVLFGREGGHVVCADLRQEWNEETVRLIKEEGGEAVAVDCDVAIPSQLADTVRVAVEWSGKLDVMFNNAGIASPHRLLPLDEHSDDDFDRLIAVNCRGVFNGCRESVAQFKRQGSGGVIVNTGSIAGLVAVGSVLYGATKGFIIQMTRALAIEVAPLGVRVNCVCPGGMPTNFISSDGDRAAASAHEGYHPENQSEKLFHPLGKTIDPYDAAEAVLFLASDQAGNVTGVALPVDGGYVAK